MTPSIIYGHLNIFKRRFFIPINIRRVYGPCKHWSCVEYCKLVTLPSLSTFLQRCNYNERSYTRNKRDNVSHESLGREEIFCSISQNTAIKNI